MPKGKRYAKKMGRKPYRVSKSLRSHMPIFSEMFNTGTLTVPASGPIGSFGGLLNTQYQLLPQATQYASLYRQYKILRNTWYLVPRGTSVDPNATNYNVANSVPYQANGRFVYAINDTAGQSNPSQEVDVLASNGAKIRMTGDGRVIKISHKPVPVLDVAAGVVTDRFINKKNVWFNTNNANNQGAAIDVVHGHVQWWLTIPSSAAGGQVIFDVYCRMTVQFRDPA